MAALKDYQFELDGYVFGMDRPVFVDTTGFKPGSGDVMDQDQTNPITGARMMGRDTVTAGTWTWMLHMGTESPEEMLAELGVMGTKWRGGAAAFRESRAVSALRYAVGGRTRVIFGRPRKFDYDSVDGRFAYGYLPPSATFDKSDALHYDDDEQMATMHLKPADVGGAVLPGAFPLTFERAPDYVPESAVVVGGDASTAPVITFTGPVLDPSVTIGGVTVGLTGRLGAGGSVTIDTRPWAMTITRVGDTAGAYLSASTRMTRSALKPGAYSAVFRGTDTSGDSRCQVRWRNAWNTI